jgi:crossover junction endodeoxyribonuclease RuvC
MANAPQPPTRVIGIDPGLNITGYGVVVSRGTDVKLVEAGVIRLPPSHGENLPDRLESLFRELQQVMDEFKPQAMCLEEVYSHADYPRTAILMGHARGVICLAAKLAGIPVLSFSAKRVKQAVTGNGNASKLQVQRSVQHFFELSQTPHPPDVADALAVALCYVNAQRYGGNGRTGARRQVSGTRERTKRMLGARDKGLGTRDETQ